MKNFIPIFILLLNIPVFSQVYNPEVVAKPQNSQICECDYCLCSMGVTPLDFSGKGIRIDPRYLLIDRTVNNGTSSANTNGRYEEHMTIMISGIYSLSQKFSILGSIPYSIRNGRDDNTSPLVHTTGIGDVIVSGRYMPLEIHPGFSTILLAFQGGIKLPTGKAEERMSNGELIDSHLQIGTGSTDFLFGTNFLYGKNRFAFTINFLYSVKTRGKTGYRFGNDMNYDVEARYKIFESGVGRNMIMLNGGFYGEYKGVETQDKVDVANTGGNTLYLSGGVDYFITSYVLFGLQFQKPVFYHLYGIQDGETFRIKSGIQFLFY